MSWSNQNVSVRAIVILIWIFLLHSIYLLWVSRNCSLSTTMIRHWVAKAGLILHWTNGIQGFVTLLTTPHGDGPIIDWALLGDFTRFSVKCCFFVKNCPINLHLLFFLESPCQGPSNSLFQFPLECFRQNLDNGHISFYIFFCCFFPIKNISQFDSSVAQSIFLWW